MKYVERNFQTCLPVRSTNIEPIRVQWRVPCSATNAIIFLSWAKWTMDECWLLREWFRVSAILPLQVSISAPGDCCLPLRFLYSLWKKIIYWELTKISQLFQLKTRKFFLHEKKMQMDNRWNKKVAAVDTFGQTVVGQLSLSLSLTDVSASWSSRVSKEKQRVRR